MNAAQMLAHLNVAYVMLYHPDKFSQPTGLKRWLIRKFVKPIVVDETPYKKNTRTAQAFRITDARDFEREKKALIEHIQKTERLGPSYFEQKSSINFGPMTSGEWSNLFYKHADHHLTQFGV